MIVVGLFLAPLAIPLIMQLKKFNLSRVVRMLLNICLIASSFIYLLLCVYLKTEPFVFEIYEIGDFLCSSVVVFVFSPFLWIVLFYYCNELFKSLRIHKNSKLKSEKHYKYYRDNLDEISPGILIFVSMLDINVSKAVTATILKLKLMGFVYEKFNKLCVSLKNTDALLQSEKLVLSSISNGCLNTKLYKETVKKEALKYNYIKKYNKGRIIKVGMMLITIISPIILTIACIKLNDYTFENYGLYQQDDGIVYVELEKDQDIEKLYKQVTDINDFYHSDGEVFGEKKVFYNYKYIRADRLQYGIVLYARFLNILCPLSIVIFIVSYFVCLFILIELIIHFNNNYKRTAAGNKLLNKAYALKNYLKDFSLMKNRTQKELELWDFYMIYAVALDVNTKIENEIIEDYLKDTITIAGR